MICTILFGNCTILAKMVMSCLYKYEKQFQNSRTDECNNATTTTNPCILFCLFLPQHPLTLNPFLSQEYLIRIIFQVIFSL